MTMPLPSLPPVPNVDPEQHRPGGPSIVEQIRRDHDLIADLCGQVAAQADPQRRATLIDVLVASVTRHLSAEEQYLYPAVRAGLPDGEGLGAREVAADVEILRAMVALDAAAPDAAEHPALLAEVTDLLAGHAERISAGILPALERTLPVEDLVRLGNRITIARDAAPTRPRPDTPVTPPWNKVVEPGLGALDKVRDLLAGRPTRAEDLEPPGGVTAPGR
jgi:hypothetical protein